MMALKEPESMEELVYWTKRKIGDGNVMVWVFRGECPSCGKGTMGKPVDRSGHVKIRASVYECPECSYSIEKKAYEETLTANIRYTCPECKASGETQVPYKRKKVKGADSLIFECGTCHAKVLVTKKMKEI